MPKLIFDSLSTSRGRDHSDDDLSTREDLCQAEGSRGELARLRLVSEQELSDGVRVRLSLEAALDLVVDG